MGDRRHNHDRRGWQAMPALPFYDGQGELVTRDRRRRADRRLSLYRVEWLESPRPAGGIGTKFLYTDLM